MALGLGGACDVLTLVLGRGLGGGAFWLLRRGVAGAGSITRLGGAWTVLGTVYSGTVCGGGFFRNLGERRREVVVVSGLGVFFFRGRPAFGIVTDGLAR